MSVIYSSPTIVIKQFAKSEESLFCDFFNDPEVMRYLPAFSISDYKALFAKVFDDYEHGPFGRWGVFDATTGFCIGNCLLRVFEEDSSAYEIGYSIARAYWGKGIGSEIAAALVAYTFSHTETGDLTALTHPDNIGSQRVLEKAGFVRTGNIVRRGADLYFFVLKRGKMEGKKFEMG
ncbi:GNAT family N-acetyltransferase [Pedobacter sp. BMA]|uniref:GNAT family N-acetyltransferase n=1 Tax=Pedobacter sp. BMA TaxID=1663685 RepID=UPI00064AC745|nr:GNAT family N-acetyltransferase [Pedobacter sp. BMA]KLT65471.1 hypothetical protein AB669_10365 [Pedobacter sp. BMA]